MKGFVAEILSGIALTVFFVLSLSTVNSKIISEDIEKDFRMSVADSVSTQTVTSQVEVSTNVATAEKTKQATEGNSYFAPKSKRNPFLSPQEYEKIRIMEEQRLAQEELIKRMGTNDPVVKREDPTKKYKLQGIVGKYAIINGEMIGEGENYKKEIILEKVYSNYVIIKYKGKQYRLILK
ncbi:MAG: hypothetical protein ACP5SD_04295 [Elusimicrobiales bacterium]|nr:hypothetical protein [Elusimicrobiales bacterium]HOJ86198.1 hypothetical protein [Elusimicrobiales bacterium]HOL62440.1 hypothetical protein [Elusimicrobiales bacterium]HPO96204.1 hypothetical protein [Elusimicrobiales bacterium]